MLFMLFPYLKTQMNSPNIYLTLMLLMIQSLWQLTHFNFKIPYEYKAEPPVFSTGSIILNWFCWVSLKENVNPYPLKNSSTKFQFNCSSFVA